MTESIPTTTLHRVEAGFYTWSNDKDILAPDRLSANVYRDGSGDWEIRLFTATGRYASLSQSHPSLALVRESLARLAASYDPSPRLDEWSLQQHAKMTLVAADNATYERHVAVLKAETEALDAR